jgi:hypothetical protein
MIVEVANGVVSDWIRRAESIPQIRIVDHADHCIQQLSRLPVICEAVPLMRKEVCKRWESIDDDGNASFVNLVQGVAERLDPVREDCKERAFKEGRELLMTDLPVKDEALS